MPQGNTNTGTTALTNGQSVDLKLKSVAFLGAADLAYPVLPAATAPPDGKAAMVKLSASLVALGAAGYLGLY